MEAEPQHQGDIQAVVQLEVGQAFMHRLLNKEKTLFSSGVFRIAKLENNQGEPVHFLNLNSFYYGIQANTFFIKVVYSETTSYIFPHFENGLSAISIPTEPTFTQALDELFSRVAKLYDVKSALEQPQIQNLITQHYPTLPTEQIYNPDVVKKVINDTGSLLNKAFTFLGGYIKTGVEKAGGYVETKVAQGEPTEVSENTKNKWQSIKTGTVNMFNVSSEYACKILNPVVTKAKQYGGDITKKINESDNKTVKYVKELGVVSGKAVGQAVDGLVKSGTGVAQELGSQSKKIIDKKYGPDVINTLVGERKEQKEKKEGEGAEAKEPKEEPKAAEEEDSNVRLNNVSSENLYPQIKDEK